MKATNKMTLTEVKNALHKLGYTETTVDASRLNDCKTFYTYKRDLHINVSPRLTFGIDYGRRPILGKYHICATNEAGQSDDTGTDSDAIFWPLFTAFLGGEISEAEIVAEYAPQSPENAQTAEYTAEGEKTQQGAILTWPDKSAVDSALETIQELAKELRTDYPTDTPDEPTNWNNKARNRRNTLIRAQFTDCGAWSLIDGSMWLELFDLIGFSVDKETRKRFSSYLNWYGGAFGYASFKPRLSSKYAQRIHWYVQNFLICLNNHLQTEKDYRAGKYGAKAQAANVSPDPTIADREAENEPKAERMKSYSDIERQVGRILAVYLVDDRSQPLSPRHHEIVLKVRRIQRRYTYNINRAEGFMQDMTFEEAESHDFGGIYYVYKDRSKHYPRAAYMGAAAN